MGALIRRVRAAVDLRDLHVYGGAVVVAGGIQVWSAPAALIWLGLFLVFLGLVVARPRRG
jgi:hypothetical protein